MRALYEIDADQQKALNDIDQETGEWLGAEAFEALQQERNTKLEGVALSIKIDDADIASIQREIETLTKRVERIQKGRDGKAEWLKNVLQGEKFSTSKCEVKFTRSQSVQIDDEEAFCKMCYETGNNDFVTHKEVITDKPNKANIKKFLNSGGELDGASLQINLNMKVN